MGRTIHYAVKGDGINQITEEQWQKVEKLQDEYNSRNNWSCENLCMERESIFPNWKNWEKSGLDPVGIWKVIRGKMSTPDGLKEMTEQELIQVHKGGYLGKEYLMSGFTKVRDDEANAAIVVRFLMEVSKIAPALRIEVKDEGNLLRCPVIIENGMMSPDIAEMTKDIKYWRKRMRESETNEKKFWSDLIKKHLSFFRLENEKLDPGVFINKGIEVF